MSVTTILILLNTNVALSYTVLIMLSGTFINGPYALITTAVSSDLVSNRVSDIVIELVIELVIDLTE